MGAAAAIAVMRLKEREARDDFIRAGATTPATARSLDDIGIHEGGAVRRLRKRAVIRESSPGLFYFDEDVWQAVRGMRRRMAVVMLIVMALIVLMTLYGTVNR
ncbi:MAG TPA: hypothetical protein VKO87_14340 [Gemmatimonadaceae bacterium]|nr:hypothetical protein [Gemmatimonadaceae bacterium]